MTPEGGGSLAENGNVAIAQIRDWPASTSPQLCTGIKLICDSAVDVCTAALSHRYTDHVDILKPLWPLDSMEEVLPEATSAGLQVAVYGISDATVS
jgi:predicted amidohydrolase YtcJ